MKRLLRDGTLETPSAERVRLLKENEALRQALRIALDLIDRLLAQLEKR